MSENKNNIEKQITRHNKDYNHLMLEFYVTDSSSKRTMLIPLIAGALRDKLSWEDKLYSLEFPESKQKSNIIEFKRK